MMAAYSYAEPSGVTTSVHFRRRVLVLPRTQTSRHAAELSVSWAMTAMSRSRLATRSGPPGDFGSSDEQTGQATLRKMTTVHGNSRKGQGLRSPLELTLPCERPTWDRHDRPTGQSHCPHSTPPLIQQVNHAWTLSAGVRGAAPRWRPALRAEGGRLRDSGDWPGGVLLA